MTTKPLRSRTPRRRASASIALSSHEKPLVDDIRWLGRILGDIIREQEGEAAFSLVEKIRRLDRKSTRLNSSHIPLSRMPSSA